MIIATGSSRLFTELGQGPRVYAGSDKSFAGRGKQASYCSEGLA